MEKIIKERKISKKITQIVKIPCKKCKKHFGIDKDYIGIVTCPYCGEYVEG